MLDLDHRRVGLGVGPVLEAYFRVIGIDVVDVQAVFPRERQHLVVTGKIVFDVALGADVGAHLLPRGRLQIDAAHRHGILERRTGDAQGHRIGIVTVGAGAGDVEIVAQVIVRRVVEFFPPHFLDQGRRVGRVAVGAGSRLVDYLGSQGFFLVLQGVIMAALLVEVLAEGIAGPDAHHGRIAFQLAVGHGAAIGRADRRVLGLHEGVVVAGKVLAPHGRIDLARRDLDDLQRILFGLGFARADVDEQRSDQAHDDQTAGKGGD